MTKTSFALAIFVNLTALCVALLFGADIAVAAGIGLGAQLVVS